MSTAVKVEESAHFATTSEGNQSWATINLRGNYYFLTKLTTFAQFFSPFFSPGTNRHSEILGKSSISDDTDLTTAKSNEENMAPIQIRALYLSREEMRAKWEGKPECKMPPWLLMTSDRIYLSHIYRVYLSLGQELPDYLEDIPSLRYLPNLEAEFKSSIRRLYAIGLRIQQFLEAKELELAEPAAENLCNSYIDTDHAFGEMGNKAESSSHEVGASKKLESTSADVAPRYRVRSRNADDEWENHGFDSDDAAIECCVKYAKAALGTMVDILLEIKQILGPLEEKREAASGTEKSISGTERAGNDEEGNSGPKRKKQRTEKEQQKLDGGSQVSIAT